METGRRRLPVLSAGLTVLWLLGRLLGDGHLVTALLFYLPSLGVAAAWLLVGALGHGRKIRIAALVLAGLLLSDVYFRDFKPKDATPTADTQATTLELVHWNVFRNYLPWTAKIRRLRELEADIYVLNELPRQVTRGNWALKLGPGFNYAFGDLMVVGCRGTVKAQSFQAGDGLQILKTVCRIDGRDLHIWAVDVVANPLQWRNPILKRLTAQIEAERPDFVVGDMNTPRRASPLQDLPAPYVHAYDVAGTGLPYTWPTPFPVIDLDQLVLGPDIDAARLDYRSTPVSDHRLQVLRFRVRPGESSGTGTPDADQHRSSPEDDGAVDQPQK